MKNIDVLGDRKMKYRFGKSLAFVFLYAGAMQLAVANEPGDSAPANPPSDSVASSTEANETDELLNFLSDASTSTENTDANDNNAAANTDTNDSTQASDNAAADAAAATYDLIPVNTDVEKTAPESLAPRGQYAQLEEIVVTATKRNESVRQIPSTINVLTGDKLQAQGAREMADFADQIPGLQIQDQSTSSTRKIVIRGIAPDNTTNQTVGIVYGDVPVGDPIGSYTNVDPDTWDLATVEVLKGPQGTLFGASSLAGLIRYVPKAPQLGEWQAKGFAEMMSIKDGSAAPTFGAAVNVPVGETFAFRLAGTLEHKPGLIDIVNPARNAKDADDSRKWTGRAMALWAPNDRLVINALYAAQNRKADEVSFVTSYDGNYTRTDAPQASFSQQAFKLATIDARYEFDWATLVSLSSYQTKLNHFDLDTSYALVYQLGQAGITAGRTKRFVDTTGFMQEFRLVSPDDGPWTWQGGVFFSNTNAKLNADIYLNALAVAQPLLNLIPEPLRLGFITENGVSLGSVELDPLKANERALFGELSRQLGDVKLTVGGRLYTTQVSGVNKLSGLLPFITSNGQTEVVQNLNVKGQGFSPKFALAWQATDDVLVYGSVSKGFQYGGVNAIPVPTPGSTAPLTYASSSLWAFESGVRTNWLDNTLNADITAYYQIWDNAQIAQITPPAETFVANVGSVGVKGMELSLQYLFPIDGLSLEVNGSLLSSKTTKPFQDGDGNTIPAGSTMANAPTFQSAATLGYAKAFAEVWQTNSGLSYTHTSQSFGNIQHTGILDARDMFNLNFKLSRPDLSFAPSVSVIVNNVTDQRKVVSSIAPRDAGMEPGSTEAFTVGYTRPRTLILNLAMEFK